MPNRMPPVHPGEILRQELEELDMSANTFAKALAVPANRITMILRGTRGISADTALRLARFFGTSPQFWLNPCLSGCHPYPLHLGCSQSPE